PKFEFETGAESQVTVGTFKESLWRLIFGLSMKLQDGEQFQDSGAASRNWEWTDRAAPDSIARELRKVKTVDTASLFNGLIEIGFRIELKYVGALKVSSADRWTVPVGARVAVPRKDLPGEAAVTQHYALPQRIRDGQWFGSSDAVLNVYLPTPGLYSEYLTTL